MFKQILVPIDESEQSLRALWPARTLADTTGADVIAATVVAKLGQRDDTRVELTERLATTGLPGIEPRVAVNGYTVSQGLDSLATGPDLIVVVATTGHARSRLATGSVAEELVHMQPERPTLLVGPDVDVEAFRLDGPIVAAVDPERHSPRLLDQTARFARELVMAPWVITVLDPSGQDRDEAARHEEAMARRIERMNMADVRTEIIYGDSPATSIADFARGAAASILAVGTRERDALSRLAFGSVAIETIGRSPCPVLTVHADA